MARKCTNPFQLSSAPFDPTHRFETSWILPVWALFSVRALFAIFTITTRLFILIDDCVHPSLGGCLADRQSFSYFTILTFWGLLFYFLVSSAHTLSYLILLHRRRSHTSSVSPEPTQLVIPIDRFPRILQAAQSLFYTTIVTFPPLVTIVYWSILYSHFNSGYDIFSNVSQHALNSLMCVFEIIVPRTEPMPWIHLFWLILILLGYLAVAYITQAAQGWYVYNFLDYHKVGGRGVVAGYILGIAAGICVIFAIVRGLVWLRLRLAKKLGREGEFVTGSLQKEVSQPQEGEAPGEKV